MLTSDLFENKTPAAWRAGYERGLKHYRQGPNNPYPADSEEAKEYADGYHNGELDSHEKYGSMNEGAVKELSQDLKSMSDAEFLARYKMTKAQARAEMKPGVAESTGNDEVKTAAQAIQKLQSFARDNPDFTLDQLDNLQGSINPVKTILKNALIATDGLIRYYSANKQAGNAQFIENLKNEINNFLTDRTQSQDSLTLGDLLQSYLGKINFQQGVAEDSLNEFAPGAGDDGGGEDPYKYPKPERYRRSADYFGQFEADHFDREDFDDATGVFKGYWGRTPIAYFKFDNPARTAGDDPGMGWYYEPESTGKGDDTGAESAVDRSDERKQQELGMIDKFLKSGNRPSPGSQIYQLMKKHGLAEAQNDYFKRRKDEEDRIAGVKAPAKRTPKQIDYEKKRKQQDVAEEQLAEQDLAEAVGTLELADFLFKGLEQKFPKVVERYGHEVVGDAIMDVAEENQDVNSVSDVDILIDDIIEKLQNYNGNGSDLAEATVSRLYYNVVGTSGPELRKDFGMRHDRRGWFLSESSGRGRIMDAQRAFGSPKLVEYDLAASNGAAATLGPDNVISPIGTVPKSQQINKKVKNKRV